MIRRVALLGVLALAACSTAPQRSAKAPESRVPVRSVPHPATPEPRKASPYAAADEDVSKRGHQVPGGLYLPGVADSVPDDIPDVDAIPEPEVKAEVRSARGNRSPYTVMGQSYSVIADPRGYSETGVASYYGNKFHRRQTSNGEVYDMYAFSAAHRTLPLPSYARVTNLDNGKSVIVRINDRGPFHSGRLIDLSYAAAVKLGYRSRGVAHVRVDALTPGEAAATGSLVAKAEAAKTDPAAQAQLAQQVASSNMPSAVPLAPAASAVNTEYRFDMKQNGKAMSADEFDAWLKARRIRIATGKPGRPDAPVETVPAVTPPPVTSQPVVATRSAASAPVAPLSAPVNAAGATLQVASFASETNAEHALAVLQGAGIGGARVIDARVNGRRVWRLRVGPLADADIPQASSRIAGLGFGEPNRVRD